MVTNYFPILIFIGIGIALGILMILVSRLIAPHVPTTEKLSPYECGFDAFEDARLPFDVRYYLVAILFLLFDLETAFFVPWAVVLRKVGFYGFFDMMLFLAVLVVGFIYEWKKGALEWE